MNQQKYFNMVYPQRWSWEFWWITCITQWLSIVPEKIAIPYDKKEIADEYGIKVGDVKKWIQNLGDKTNYVLHYTNLQLCLSLGVKLTNIHKVLKFR